MASVSILPEFVDYYDGISKFIQVKEAQPVFQTARVKIAEGNFDDARERLAEVKNIAKENAMDIETVDIVLSEITRYLNTRIPVGVKAADDIIWSDVTLRQPDVIEEAITELPQSLFFLRVGRPGSSKVPLMVGRKVLSDYWLQGKIHELHCSLLTPAMLLGVFNGLRTTAGSNIISYYPLTNPEKLRVIADVQNGLSVGAEVTFPFPLLQRETRQEFNTPPEGWRVDDAYDILLGNSEVRLRAYTVQLLHRLGITKGRLYDPACSSGIFLATLKAAYPDVYTIGQDLSSQMADFSRGRLDEAHCGNALNPCIEPLSADVVFVRFLNSEVVSYKEAVMLLPAVLSTVKVGGYVVIIGHTPILISTSELATYPDFEVLQNIGSSVDIAGIFQYYLLRRKSS